MCSVHVNFQSFTSLAQTFLISLSLLLQALFKCLNILYSYKQVIVLYFNLSYLVHFTLLCVNIMLFLMKRN